MAPKNNFNQQMNTYRNLENSQINALGAISKSLQDTSRLITDAGDNMKALSRAINSMNSGSDNHRRSLNALIEEETRSTKTINKRTQVLCAAIDDTISKFKNLVVAIANTSDRYAELGNRMIQTTGAAGLDVRNSRGTIVHDIVGELNAQTGNFFNPEKSYAKMLEIANTANIGSIEAIEELARPMLLATETMNVNQGQLATLLNKWYTRYNFSSADMESMIDEIRGNTAGNNATAEATMRNLETVQSWMSYYSNGNASKLEEWSKSLSKGTSWLESMNVDTSRYADYMKKIMTGEALTDTSMITLLGYSNLSGHDAQAMAASGQMEELMKALFDAETNMFASVMNDTSVKKQVADVYGQDIDNLVDAYNARYNNQNYVDLDNFKEYTESQVSAVDTVGSMYTTLVDQMKNAVSSLSEFAAEHHWSDALSILSSIYTVLVIRGGLGKGVLSGGIGGLSKGAKGLIGSWSTAATGGLGTGASTTGLLGALEMGGFNASGGALTGGAAAGLGAASALGVVGGLAGSIYGVSEGIKDFNKGNYGTGSANLAGGVAMGAGGAALGASLLGVGAANVWNPVGWALLIGGGVTLLGTAIYKNAHALSGNAEKVSTEIDAIGESIKSETQSRLNKLDDLEFSLYQEKDIQDKILDFKNSGLFKEEELENANQDTLKQLIDSYRSAAESMDEVTDGIMANLKKTYSDKMDVEQGDFMSYLWDNVNDYSNDQRMTALSMMKRGITDEKTLKKIDKYMEDGEINNKEWKSLTTSGIFNKSNLDNVAVDTNALQAAANYLGYKQEFTTTENLRTFSEIVSKLSRFDISEEEFRDTVNDLVEKGLKEQFESETGYTIKQLAKEHGFNGYRTGSNYIEKDQLANIHEGEAVVPKKYNPSANITELEMLRKYYKDSSSNETSALTNSMKEFSSMMSEIKEFLEYWKDDNDKRSAAQERLSRMSYNTRQIAQYKMV